MEQASKNLSDWNTSMNAFGHFLSLLTAWWHFLTPLSCLLESEIHHWSDRCLLRAAAILFVLLPTSWSLWCTSVLSVVFTAVANAFHSVTRQCFHCCKSDQPILRRYKNFRRSELQNLNQLMKNLVWVITSAIAPHIPKFRTIAHWRHCGICVKYNCHMVFSFPFFSFSVTPNFARFPRLNHRTDFYTVC